MKIIISGATGSLGMNLVKYFGTNEHQIVALGRQPIAPKNLLKYAEYLKVDIDKPFELPPADAVIHAAALSDDKAVYEALYKSNVIGTQNIIMAAKSCKKFIHVSSSSVYLPDKKLITEDMAGKQNNKLLSAYGKSKLEAEQKVIEMAGFESTFVLRPRALYGAGDKMILPRLLKLEKNGKILRPGPMNIKISMTHYQNFCHAVDLCLQSDKKGRHIYNVADNEVYTLANVLAQLVKTVYNQSLPVKQIPVGLLRLLALLKIGGITPLLIRAFTKDMVLDTQKIVLELGYAPTVKLADKLEEIANWVQHIGGVEVLKTEDRSLPWK